MSPPDRQPDCAGDAAAYALGALDAREAEAFRRHLETCAVCRDELAAFGHVTDALALTAPQHPVPAELRRRVMRAVSSEPRTAPRGRVRFTAVPRAWLPRPALALAGTLAVALAATLAIALGSGGSGTRLIQASLGQAELRVSSGHGDLIVRSLPEPVTGHVYEVWLLRHGAGSPSPTRTLFSVTSQGTGEVGLTQSLTGVSQVLVTQEPAGGSQTPTTAPVIRVRLA